MLIEDTLPDIRLTERAFKNGKIPTQVSVVRDGEAALAFLRRQGEFAESPRPDIILLDLGLPKKSGAEVLTEIKEDPALKHIPVIILTTSDAEQDVLDTYDRHANAYTKKPVDMNEFVETIKLIEDFWLSLVILPRREF